MNRNIYKLKLWVITDDDNEKFKDLYLDVNTIIGFFIPEKEEGIEEEGEGINILVPGDMFTIKQEKHIVDFLYDNFALKAKK